MWWLCEEAEANLAPNTTASSSTPHPNHPRTEKVAEPPKTAAAQHPSTIPGPKTPPSPTAAWGTRDFWIPKGAASTAQDQNPAIPHESERHRGGRGGFGSRKALWASRRIESAAVPHSGVGDEGVLGPGAHNVVGLDGVFDP